MAGNYSGTITFLYPELATTASCSATTTVSQSGASVNIAPMVLGGACGGMSVPFGGVTIDATGNIQGQNSGTFSDPSCGTYSYTGSGGFFGRELRISMTATSSTCWNFNMTATLSR